MIPLVGHVNELAETKRILEAEAKAVEAGRRRRGRLQVRHDDRGPARRPDGRRDRAAAEFFSFGTNDLTQMTFGFSRDDAEGGFLLDYVERQILPANPFQTLDVDGVGQLMRMAVEKGRATRPDLEIGICGEHGGDPASIAFCHEIGLDYCRCSPFRVPVARLAAAQAALGGAAERDK